MEHPVTSNACRHLRESSSYVRQWMLRQPAVKEESLTDWLLYDVSKRLPNFYYEAFTRHEEARESGADWEWWILTPGSHVKMRVQAKKVVAGNDHYASLAHANRYGLQIDKLISSAQQANAIPLYALYSCVDEQSMCQQSSEASTIDGVHIAGASAVHAKLFGGKRQAISASDLLTVTNPFSCFACCPFVWRQEQGVREYFKTYYSTTTGREEEQTNAPIGFHDEIPGYLKSFLERIPEGLPDWWAREFAHSIQGFDALLVYDFRNGVG